MLLPTVRVFVNERPYDLPTGATVRSAIMAAEPGAGSAIAAGTLRVTDGRGIDLPFDAALESGAILRVLTSARQRPDQAPE